VGNVGTAPCILNLGRERYEWSARRSAVHWTGAQMGPRADPGDVEGIILLPVLHST